MNISKQTARKLYRDDIPEWFKNQLVDEFGQEILKGSEYNDIKKFEDACDVLGINPYHVISDKDSPDEIAYKKLKKIVKAVNNGWEPDWSNSDQRKYYPYFEVLPSGSGFSGSVYDSTITLTCVGSRLCTDTSEKALYLAEQFKDLYIEFLLTKNN